MKSNATDTAGITSNPESSDFPGLGFMAVVQQALSLAS